MSRLKLSEISDAPAEGKGKQIHFEHMNTRRFPTSLGYFRSKVSFTVSLTSVVAVTEVWEKVH